MNGFYLFIRSNIFLEDKVTATLFSVLAAEDVFLPLSIANASSSISDLINYCDLSNMYPSFLCRELRFAEKTNDEH